MSRRNGQRLKSIAIDSVSDETVHSTSAAAIQITRHALCYGDSIDTATVETQADVSSFSEALYKALLIGCLSIDVVRNLLSSRQIMNLSFDSCRIGAVGRERFEVVFAMTLNVRDGQLGRRSFSSESPDRWGGDVSVR